MNMYSVLLIDDEPWVLEDLKSLLNWEDAGFKIAGEANDAETAKQLVESLNPDVVISDIRMPGLNGIQLLETYEKTDIAFKTIFVTAYGKFEYAKKALELGAEGYLLKPVDPEELAVTLAKVKKQLDSDVGIRENVSKWEKTHKLYNLLDCSHDGENGDSLLEQIGIPHVSECYVVAIAKESEEKVSEALQDFPMHASVVPFSEKRCLVFIQNESTYFNVITYKNIIVHLKNAFEKHNIYLGISRIADRKRKFRIAFMQADGAVDYSFITHSYVNVYREENTSVQDVTSLISRQKSMSGKMEVLEKLPYELRKKHFFGKKLFEVFECLVDQFEFDYDLRDMDIKELVNQFNTIESFLDYLSRCANDKGGKRNKKTSSRSIVKEIIEYIQSNYNQKIMINDLAQQFFLNPSYLSNLFKLETGKSFTAYLVECRLQKAANLLETTDLTLYEISAKVGYEDYFHFSKLFKKHMQSSPANYRKNKAPNASSEIVE